LDRRAQPLESLGESGAVRRRRAFEEQLRGELGDSGAPRCIGDGARVDQRRYRHERELSDRRNDQPQTVGQNVALETWQLIRARRRRLGTRKAARVCCGARRGCCHGRASDPTPAVNVSACSVSPEPPSPPPPSRGTKRRLARLFSPKRSCASALTWSAVTDV